MIYYYYTSIIKTCSIVSTKMIVHTQNIKYIYKCGHLFCFKACVSYSGWQFGDEILPWQIPLFTEKHPADVTTHLQHCPLNTEPTQDQQRALQSVNQQLVNLMFRYQIQSNCYKLAKNIQIKYMNSSNTFKPKWSNHFVCNILKKMISVLLPISKWYSCAYKCT